SSDDDLARESARSFDRGGADRPDRPARRKGAAPAAGAGNAMYKIALGRRDGVAPGHIVGAIANEAGLSAQQIGSIDIRPTHSLVELPEDLSSQQWSSLSKTRIGGELIRLERDSGPRRHGGDRQKGVRKGGPRGSDQTPKKRGKAPHGAGR